MEDEILDDMWFGRAVTRPVPWRPTQIFATS